jgi:hypothetical protein
MLNPAMDAAGFAAAVEMGLDVQSFINMSETAREFDAFVQSEGLKAALSWRGNRYEERLAEQVAPMLEAKGRTISAPLREGRLADSVDR